MGCTRSSVLIRDANDRASGSADSGDVACATVRRLASLLLCAGAVAMSGCRPMQANAQVPPSDQQFMLTAASVGTAEIEPGKLASERGASADVRSFGRKMVDEHTRIDATLTDLADRKKVRLLKAMDPASRTLYDELSHMSGPAFDRKYAVAQLHVHSMGNGLYRSEAQNGEVPDVKAFAADRVPIGMNHLQHAAQLLRGLPASSAQSRRENGRGRSLHDGRL
jgi:putative membrane protein